MNYRDRVADYAEEKGVFSLLSRLTEHLIVTQPTDPLDGLLDYLRSGLPPRLVVLGPPGGGKGTLCERLVKAFGVVHISTGDALRGAVADETPLGNEAKPYMEAASLVPDKLIMEIVKERLMRDDCKKKGWLLDGMPRTRPQALSMQELGLLPTAIILLDVSDSTVVERMSGRRLDPVTKKIYHITFNPPTDPRVATRLIQRDDDTEAKLVVRLHAYRQHRDAVTSCFPPHILHTIDGNATAEQVFACTAGLLRSRIDVPHAPRRPPRVILKGVPGSGRRDVAHRLKDQYDCVVLSGEELLRAAGVEGGAQNAAPATLAKLLRDRIQEHDCYTRGWVIFDGTPHTAEQGQALLDAGVVPSRFIQLKCEAALGLERLALRTIQPLTKEEAVKQGRHHADNLDALRQVFTDQIDVDASGEQQRVFELVRAVID